MSRCEGLEARRLFATLSPDVAWGNDGSLDRSRFQTFVGATGDGLLASETGYDRRLAKNTQTIKRFTAAGTFDPAFTPVRSIGSVSPFVDGRGRLVAGVTGDTGDELRLTRYTTAGKPDASFGDNGTVAIAVNHQTSPIESSPRLAAIAPAADGGTYVAARYRVYYPNRTHTVSVVEVYKLDAAGRMVTSFAGTGRISFRDDALYDSTTWMATDSTGRLLVGVGNFEAETVRRYAASTGQFDPTFGDTHGRLVLDGNQGAGNLAIDGQDRVLSARIVDVETAAPTDVLVERFVDGRADASFAGGDGFRVVTPAVQGERPTIGRVLPQRNGKVVVQIAGRIHRLNANGTSDTTFDGDGVADTNGGAIFGQLRDGSFLASVTTNFFGYYDNVTRLVPQAMVAALGKSGTLYVTGTAADDDYELRPVSNSSSTAFYTDGVQRAIFAGVKSVVADFTGGFADDAGDDTFSAAALALPMNISGGQGDDDFTTGGGRDIVRTGEGNDTVSTGAGKDFVDPGVGNNVTSTGSGNDVIENNNGHDTINAGSGNDVVQSDDKPNQRPYLGDRIDMGDGDDRAYAPGGRHTLLGGYGDDTLTAGDGDDSIDGGAGRDLLFGGEGDDTINGGSGRDRLYGNEGADRLAAGASDDTIVAGVGNDTLLGEGGNDVLYAGLPGKPVAAAVNRIDGGAGVDQYERESDDDMLAGVEVEREG